MLPVEDPTMETPAQTTTGTAAGDAAASITHREPARDLPLVESCDVLVAGGGPAGFELAARRRYRSR